MAAKARRGPSATPTSNTPKFCKVSGTGVKGNGNVIRAHSATNRLALTTKPALMTAGETPEEISLALRLSELCISELCINVLLIISYSEFLADVHLRKSGLEVVDCG